MNILDLRLWLVIPAALVLSAGGGYLKGRADGKTVEHTAAREDAQAWHDNADAAYALYLEVQDRKKIEYRTLTKTLEAAKNATPDIPDCRTGDDWMRIYRNNAAIANGTAVHASAGSTDGADAR